jgi:hypothetical protein
VRAVAVVELWCNRQRRWSVVGDIGGYPLEVVSMPEPVRCDVCGKLFSSRHVKSHQRLAHAKDKSSGSGAEESKIKTILEAYKTLAPENKARVRKQLAELEQKPS